MAARPFFKQAALMTALALACPVAAQTTTPVPAPQPVESQPLPPASAQTGAPIPNPSLANPPAATLPAPAQSDAAPAPASPAPSVPAPQPTPPVTAQPGPASPAPPQAPPQVTPGPPAIAGTLETLAPPSSDPSMPDRVELAAKPAALLRGASTWDDGYDKLTAAFTRLREAMAASNIRVTGKPVAIFIETDDLGFRFEAQLPIERAPVERPTGLATDIRFGLTPGGTAWRFVHRAPYEDIDSTYEAITAYLDQRGIDAKEAFIEEYITLGAGPADDGLEINIFVQPRK